MIYVSNMNHGQCFRYVYALVLITLNCSAAEEFTFDTSEFEKKTFEFGGYAELLYEHMQLRQDAALYYLNFTDQSDLSHLDRATASLEVFGNYQNNKFGADFTLHGEAYHDQVENDEFLHLYEGFISFEHNPSTTVQLGKKALKWGKGYAWNPIAFVERRKDPNDPDLAREGYIMATADYIRSQDSQLKTIAITPVVLPVYEHINDT